MEYTSKAALLLPSNRGLVVITKDRLYFHSQFDENIHEVHILIK